MDLNFSKRNRSLFSFKITFIWFRFYEAGNLFNILTMMNKNRVSILDVLKLLCQTITSWRLLRTVISVTFKI